MVVQSWLFVVVQSWWFRCDGFVVVCGGFVVVCGGILWWFRGGLWWFVVVFLQKSLEKGHVTLFLTNHRPKFTMKSHF